jgi:LemA protein
MSTAALIASIAGGAVVLLVLVVITTYNRLVRLNVQSENAWADVDVQLKRRHDLIPNLVETVKGYAGHEQGAIKAVVDARARAVSAETPGSRAHAEGALAGALSGLLALAESYPQLRAVESFASLQGALREVEEAVQNSRRYYNAVVRDLNTKLAQFPSNLVAGMFSFRPRDFFEVPAAGERDLPKVSFTNPAA